MENHHLQQLESAISTTRQKLVNHPVYANIKDLDGLRCFMENHVYAVWDFMSLLKALQINLTCVTLPWVPVGNAATRFLINEIVAGEESDVDEAGVRTSHFELYINAMDQAEADTEPILGLIRALKTGSTIKYALDDINIRPDARKFMDFTFETLLQESRT